MGVTEDVAKWMSFLDDNVLVTQLTIPGTHNSHSTKDNYGGGPGPINLDGWAQTQWSPVSTQLIQGVRFVDLRVGEPSFSMRHGLCGLKGTLDDVVKSINDFLSQHPTETVLVSIKWDDPNNGEPSHMDAEVEKIWKTHNWYSDNEWPKLNQVRGKAILLRRFGGASTLGIDFGGFYGHQSQNSPGAWDQHDNGIAISGQSSATVWGMVWPQINKAAAASISENRMYFTGVAHTGFGDDWQNLNVANIIPALMTPLEYANDLNPHLMQFLNNENHHEDPKSHRYGTIIMDYFRRPYGLEIISRNWTSWVYNPTTYTAMANDNPIHDVNSPHGDSVKIFFTRNAVLRLVVNGVEQWSSGKVCNDVSNNHLLRFEQDGNLCIWRNDPSAGKKYDGRSFWWSTETRNGWDSRLRLLAGPPYILIDHAKGAGEVSWSTTWTD